MSLVEEFMPAVRRMRDRQREYYRDRTQSSLIRAKEAEKRVDELLDEWRALHDAEAARQMELFA